MFTIKASLKHAWEVYKANFEISVFATLFIIVLGYLSDDKTMPQNFLLGLTAVIVLIIAGIGYIRIFLKIHEGQPVEFEDLFKSYPLFWRYIGVSILFPLLVLVGLVLLIIPGLFWAIRFSFSQIAMVDKNLGPVAAMKESYRITKGLFWKLFLFWIVIIFINILGSILFIGTLVSLPVSAIASVYVYKELQKRSG